MQPPAIIRLVSAANTPPPAGIPAAADIITWLSDGAFPIASVAGYLLPGTRPYDVWFSLPGLYVPTIEYLIGMFARSVTFPANFAGSSGKTLINPTSARTFTLRKSGVSCGTIAVSTGGVYTFASTGGLAVSFTGGTDWLSVVTPTGADATMSDFGFTLAGLR